MRAALSAILLATSIFSAPALAAGNRCEAEIAAAAQAYGIPEGILYSVGLTETGRRGSLQPYALNVEGEAHFASSQAKAVAIFEDARRQGKTLIDLGCMQINHHYHTTRRSRRWLRCSIRQTMSATPHASSMN